MKLFVRCALVGLWIGLSTVVATAEETESMCRCQGDRDPNVQQIRRVLLEPLKQTGLDFTEEPLENVVSFLQDEYGIPIQLDDRAMEDAGLTRDEPTTIRIANVSLKSALRLMLELKGLTYVIRNEVLIITTNAAAEANLVTCVYDVRDVIGQNRGNKELAALVDAILSCVAMETWAVHKGGEAEIKSLQPGLLVISQTQVVHEEIGDLLTLIRDTIAQPNRAAAGEEFGMMGDFDGAASEFGGNGRAGRGSFGMGGEPGTGGFGGRGGDGGRGGRGGMGGMGGGRGGYGGGMGMEREPEPTPAEDDLFGP